MSRIGYNVGPPSGLPLAGGAASMPIGGFQNMNLNNGNMLGSQRRQNANYMAQQNPESIARRAQELLAIGKAEDAYGELETIFKSVKFRQLTVKSAQDIVLRYIDLAVSLRKHQDLKDNLNLFKNMVQNTSIASIDVVVRYYITQAESLHTQARRKCADMFPDIESDVVETDDESPEAVLMSAVSAESDRDRLEREVVQPSLRALLQAYRNVLDILKNNARLEVIYQNMAHASMTFCRQHGLKNDFRRICEDLGKHLNDIGRAQHNAVNLDETETLQRYLDTRFLQLDISVELSLWAQAFKSVEDIHNLLTMTKRLSLKPDLMKSYYAKLAQIFLVGENGLFHAASLNQYYTLAKGDADAETLKQLSRTLVLAVLSIPVVTDDVDLKVSRLTALLGLGQIPDRDSLVAEAVLQGALKSADSADVQTLYNRLQVDFSPLTTCKSVAPIIKRLEADAALSMYVKPLKSIIISRLFQDLSQVYDVMSIERVLKLVEPLYDLKEAELENIIMTHCLNGSIQARIDHISKTLLWKQSLFGQVASTSDVTQSAIRYIQQTPAQLVRTQLSSLAQVLDSGLESIYPQRVARLAQESWEKAMHAEKLERDAILHKRMIVRMRGELLAKNARLQEEQERELRAQRALEMEESERRQSAEDALKRQQDQLARDIALARIKDNEELARSLMEKSSIKFKEEDILTLDKDKLLEMQVEQLKRTNRDHEEKLRVLFKRKDHVERAMRRAEIPLLAQDYKKQIARDQEAYERASDQRKINAKQEHQKGVEAKRRLARTLADLELFKSEITSSQSREFEKRQKAAVEAIAKAKSERRQRIMEARAASVAAEREEEARRLRAAEEEALRAAKVAEEEASRAAKMAEEEEAAKERKRQALLGEAAARKAKEDELEQSAARARARAAALASSGDREKERTEADSATPGQTGKWVPRHRQTGQTGLQDKDKDRAERSSSERGSGFGQARGERSSGFGQARGERSSGLGQSRGGQERGGQERDLFGKSISSTQREQTGNQDNAPQDGKSNGRYIPRHRR